MRKGRVRVALTDEPDEYREFAFATCLSISSIQGIFPYRKS